MMEEESFRDDVKVRVPFSGFAGVFHLEHGGTSGLCLLPVFRVSQLLETFVESVELVCEGLLRVLQGEGDETKLLAGAVCHLLLEVGREDVGFGFHAWLAVAVFTIICPAAGSVADPCRIPRCSRCHSFRMPRAGCGRWLLG